MFERLVSGIRHTYLRVKQRQVDRFLADAAQCQQVQHARLFEKIRRNRDSDFGRKHGFSSIQSVHDFRRQVPVATYETYRPYAEEVKKGKIDAMFGPGTKVLMFSMTSGTTSQSKFVPITNFFFDEYRKTWNTWGLACFRDHPDLLTKHTLTFGSDWQQFHTEGGIPCGNISGLVAETRPRLSNPLFLLPPEVNKVSGTQNKQYTILRFALPSCRVGMVAAANPLTLLNLARLADTERESLIRDLYDGRLSEHVDVPPGVRHSLADRIGRRHPDRARQLEKIVQRTGHLYPKDFWPEMSVISVWTGGSVGVYLPKVRHYFGDQAVFRDHGLSASEGRMTTPIEDGTSAGVLDYNTHYYEFIPEGEHEGSQPTVLEAHELEEGKNYYILLSTLSGLYRYDIHDVVQCVGFVGTCPVIDFLNKGAHFSSMTGEKLSEFQVMRAVPDAIKDVGLSIEHFTLAPIAGEPAHYALLIEEELENAVAQQLAQCVDARLAEVNCEYEDRRASKRLDPLQVQPVPKGSWTAYRQQQVSRQGASFEAYKHPFLATKTDFVQRIGKLSEAEPPA